MSSDQVPSPGRSGREEEVLMALREASRHNPRLVRQPPQEVAHQLALGGYLQDEPSREQVAEMMLQFELEGEEFAPDVEPGEV